MNRFRANDPLIVGQASCLPETGRLEACPTTILGFSGSQRKALQTRFTLLILLAGSLLSGWSAETNAPASRYEFRAEHDPDGIGKFYFGREIARVMGHQGADWLERPEREQEERADLLMPALGLRPGDAVADIGCGSGFHTRRLARIVGTNGLVYAVDIQPEMLTQLTNRLAAEQIHNVRPVLGSITDPRLPPASVNLILMVDVYHEFDHPHEMIAAMLPALKPEGRLVFVEFRGEDPVVPIKPLHKMTEAQLRKEMTAHPLEWVETLDLLPRQHIVVFRPRR